MTRAGSLLLALVLATAALSGCLGLTGDGSEGADPTNETAQSPGSQAASSPAGDASSGSSDGLETLAFAAQPPVNETRWANGSFGAHEGCVPAGCLADTAEQTVELSSVLPEQTPATIRAELSYGSGPAPIDPLHLFVYSQDTTFYSYETTDEEGLDVVEATVLKGSEPVVVEVFYGLSDGQAPEVDYTLRIDIASAETVVPPGAALAVPLEPGQPIVAERVASDSQDPPRLWTYGPDDGFLGTLTGDGDRLETAVPAESSSGEHVLVVPEEAPPVALRTNATNATLRALPLAFEPGEAHPVQGPQAVEWSFELSERPLAVGMYYTTSQPLGASATEGQAALEGPQGSLLDTDLGCQICLTTAFGSGQASPIGDEGVVPGSYSATYEPGAEAGFSVGHFTLTYER